MHGVRRSLRNVGAERGDASGSPGSGIWRPQNQNKPASRAGISNPSARFSAQRVHWKHGLERCKHIDSGMGSAIQERCRVAAFRHDLELHLDSMLPHQQLEPGDSYVSPFLILTMIRGNMPATTGMGALPLACFNADLYQGREASTAKVRTCSLSYSG